MLAPVVVTPEVYVDAVIFQLIDDELAVLLTQRELNPFKGKWALPGGINPIEETTYRAMERILKEKTNVRVSELGFIEQLYTFDTVVGNPRGPAVSVIYVGLGKNITPRATPISRNSQFFSVKQVPNLAFDHNEIVHYAHQRLKSKLSYTNAVFALLPKLFTLSQLQDSYEAVLEQSLDKRNFRKKFLSLDLIQPTTEFQMTGAHRPAKLYRFNVQSLSYLNRSFD
ncbi:MAG TPA: NUDIX domain-containing protein [Candidatus Saccharimonadales bacterium]|nr:NUDIX domain-containing protein [Candidatus Saccharimonadales bacterium]